MFGLGGMLPDRVASIEEQLLRVRVQFDSKTSDIDKNVYLNALMDRNETLFYRFVHENLEEVVPILYTPVVAKTCSHWSRIYRSDPKRFDIGWFGEADDNRWFDLK